MTPASNKPSALDSRRSGVLLVNTVSPNADCFQHPLQRSAFVTMGSTIASSFPHIKEVRTFLIDGVGSGGDYHNVSSIVQWVRFRKLC